MHTAYQQLVFLAVSLLFTPLIAAQKYVVAHHMVGNTYPYTVKDWADDIALAYANGIDGFALNVGRDYWQPARVADAFTAAAQSKLPFKMFMSFDMTSLPCGSPSDANQLLNYVRQYASHPNQLRYPPGTSKSLVSTFGGEYCSFGQSSVAAGWKSQFKGPLGGGITFVPSFFGDPKGWVGKGYGDLMDGDFNWDSAWPFTLTTSTFISMLKSVGSSLASLPSAAPGSPARNLLQKILTSFDFDTQHINGLKTLGSGKIYMAAVSPWFFTHYSPQTYNKNFVYLSDLLWPFRWETLVTQRALVNLVEIISWNDYGESHYIGPIKGAQPNSNAWVDGMPHTVWLYMTQYYATAFKTGKYPTIVKDKIYAWARSHSKYANAPDGVGRPANFELMEDSIFAVVMTRLPSVVTMSTSTNPNDKTKSKTFQVPAGVTKLSIPITAGGVMRVTITRAGQTIAAVAPGNFSFRASPPSYNFNAYVAMATSP